MAKLGDWLEPHPHGIHVKPIDAWIDPSIPAARALVTHGHADHARGGHDAVWATPETLAIMEARYGPQAGNPVAYGETIRMGEVDIGYVPAGHVLGSAQIVLDYRGERLRASADLGYQQLDFTSPLRNRSAISTVFGTHTRPSFRSDSDISVSFDW